MVQTCLFMSCVLAALLAVPSSAYPSPSNYFRDDGPYEPEEIGNMLERLENLIQMERKIESFKDDISRNDKFHRNIEVLNEIMGPHDKRGLDLGLSRGYSGALHANHLVGMAAANYAGGPGRRRRDAAAAAAH